MKLDVARAYANALLEACDIAEHQGRDALVKDDLKNFQALDDVARAELGAAIAEASAP